VGITLAVTSVLYLGLAVVTIAVLGTGGGSMAPLADLLRRAIGPAGTAAGAVAAIVLTLGAVNAYVNGAAAMTGRLLGGPRRPPGAAGAAAGEANGSRPGRLLLLAAIAGTGLPLIALYGVGLVSPVSLVAIPTTLFLTVYLGSMLAATRVLHGLARLAAVPATAATAIMLAYCGWALAVPAAIIAVVTVTGSIRRSR
jgi:amino acid efflux transporter